MAKETEYKGYQLRETHREWDKWLTEIGIDTSELEIVGEKNLHVVYWGGRSRRPYEYNYTAGTINMTKEDGERWRYSLCRGELTVKSPQGRTVRKEPMEFLEYLRQTVESENL